MYELCIMYVCMYARTYMYMYVPALNASPSTYLYSEQTSADTRDRKTK